MWSPMSPLNTDAMIILASQSPRRRYLLEQAGLVFQVKPSQFDEATIPLSTPSEYVTRQAEAKAFEIASRFPKYWVIGADTIVSIDNAILGKPGSAAEAFDMLRQLSGRIHQVFTGYCICCEGQGRRFSDVVKTDVYFKTLTPEEIDWYIQSGEPFDKAGAYAIQGLGTFLVKSIRGSYTNVVGLPVCEIIELLIKEKVIGFKVDKQKLSGAHP